MTHAVQISGKTHAGAIYVVGGDSVLDVAKILKELNVSQEETENLFAAMVAAILPAGTTEAAVAAASGITHTQYDSSNKNVLSSHTATPGPAQQQGAGPSCQHGPMIWKTGVSQKSGKAWKAWMPADKCGCDVQWVR